MPKRKGESPTNEDYARMYVSYIERPLKATGEFEAVGRVTGPTLESVIEGSAMGIQNISVKEGIKEFIITNESILSVPTLDKEKEMLILSHRRRIAVKLGRTKAKKRRHEEIEPIYVGKKAYNRLQLQKTQLKNFMRMQPFMALLSKQEINRIDNLTHTLGQPRVKKDGRISIRYRGRTLSEKQFKRKLR